MADFTPLHSGPAYEPLEAELRADITNGRLAPGSKICPETVLAERYSISRGSVRVALENLGPFRAVTEGKGKRDVCHHA